MFGKESIFTYQLIWGVGYVTFNSIIVAQGIFIQETIIVVLYIILKPWEQHFPGLTKKGGAFMQLWIWDSFSLQVQLLL